MLKAELHAHTKEDPQDFISHSAKQLINHLAHAGFQVVSITNHNRVTYSEELVEYAKRKNILLIPGVERSIEGKHVLIYNINEEESRSLASFSQLKALRQRKKDIFVSAPHPFYPGSISLKSKLHHHIDLFDGIEHSTFYTKSINWNKQATIAAHKYNKPLIAGTDLHVLGQANKNFTLINAKPQTRKVIQALKKGDVKIGSRPLRLHELAIFLGYTLSASFVNPLFRKVFK